MPNTHTPPSLHPPSDNLTLNIQRSTPAEPTHSSRTTNSPHANTSAAPRQTFNTDGTRKYLNIRPAGGQPFPIKKGKKYLAADYKDGVKVKKGKGAASPAKIREAKANRVAGSRSPAQDKKGIKQDVRATSRESSSCDSDSSPERPLIEVSRSSRKDGGRVEDSASDGVGRSGDGGEKSEDDRDRKMGRDVGKRSGGAMGVRREGQ